MSISNPLDLKIRPTDRVRGHYEIEEDKAVMTPDLYCSRCGTDVKGKPVDIGFGTDNRLYLYCAGCIANAAAVAEMVDPVVGGEHGE